MGQTVLVWSFFLVVFGFPVLVFLFLGAVLVRNASDRRRDRKGPLSHV